MTSDRLIVSEVFRFPDKRYGWQMKFLRPSLYILNWQARKIEKKGTFPPAYFDKDEYKHLRLCYHYSGARGISSNDRYLFVALQNTILRYDLNNLDNLNLLNPDKRIDNRLFNGIHEIVWYEDRLYVTCAVTDSVIAVSEDGKELEHHYLGNNSFFTNTFNLPNRQLDNRLDYRLMHRVQRLFHINNVQVIDGNIYVNLNRQGSFVKIYPEAEIIIRDNGLIQSHNGQFSPNSEYILILDTGNYALRVYDSKGTLFRVIDFREFPLPIDFSMQKSFGSGHDIKAGWLRGMAFSKNDDQIVFIGISPAMIVAVDYITGKFVDYFRFRRNIWMSIHGLHNLSLNSNTSVFTKNPDLK